MAFLFRKKQHEELKKELDVSVKPTSDTRDCPHCGNMMHLINSTRERLTYKCEKCKEIDSYVNTFTNQKNKENKTPGVLVRDKSTETEEKPTKQPNSDEVNAVMVLISAVRSCMQSTNLFTFQYPNAQGKLVDRTIEPYKLMIDKSGKVIVYGYCTHEKGIRIFKLGKMGTSNPGSVPYKPRWPIEDLLDDKK